jgi:hypothetical protein
MNDKESTFNNEELKVENLRKKNVRAELPYLVAGIIFFFVTMLMIPAMTAFNMNTVITLRVVFALLMTVSFLMAVFSYYKNDPALEKEIDIFDHMPVPEEWLGRLGVENVESIKAVLAENNVDVLTVNQFKTLHHHLLINKKIDKSLISTVINRN